MRLVLLALLAVLIAALPFFVNHPGVMAAPDDVAPAPGPPGREAFAGCASCHGRPDPTLESGKLWIERVGSTACVNPPAPRSNELRGTIQTYLRSVVDLPRLESTSRAATESEGIVTLQTPDALTVLLVSDEPARQVRLVWDSAKDTSHRAVPAGEYRVQQYSVTRKDAHRREWQLWAGGPRGRTVAVKPGAKTVLALDTAVQVRVTANPKSSGYQLGIAPTGDRGMGVTVISVRDRIPATYAFHGPDGKLAEGALRYG